MPVYAKRTGRAALQSPSKKRPEQGLLDCDPDLNDDEAIATEVAQPPARHTLLYCRIFDLLLICEFLAISTKPERLDIHNATLEGQQFN